MTITLLTGDARDVLPTLPSNSVHCVVTSPPYYALRSYLDASHPDKHRELGSESTPDEYLAAMVSVFREVRRVMRPDATLWLNVGDSYFGTGKGPTPPTGFHGANGTPYPTKGLYTHHTLKSKDLMMMPARLALALQADGWWVRSDIIWAKPNPMPESCTDRPTSAHEHVFLLTKSARYFYDADAVREPHDGPNAMHIQRHLVDERLRDDTGQRRLGKQGLHDFINPAGRNLRNIWTIATHAFPEAHFATYPPELVERCIRAGTSERGCCAACGAPWVRVTERHSHCMHPTPERSLVTGATRNALGGQKEWDAYIAPTTTGWRASCQCNAEVVSCTVLDPFLGSGTTALVADRLQRHCIGIDLSLTYADMAQRRIEQDCPLFTSWAPAEDPEDERMRDLFAEAAE